MIKRSLASIVRSSSVLSRRSMIAAAGGRVRFCPVVAKNNNRTVNTFQKRFVESSTDGQVVPQEVLNLPLEKYHEEADIYLDNLLDSMEELSEAHPDCIPDVELSHGVMTLEIPAFGTYVINKQPPNKQIWLASPLSGPNRFDLLNGEWVSLRNGTKLTDILTEEVEKAIAKSQ
ncbi:ferroxidase [Saccharomyces paradoxus]|uniref:ferroxidase n=1 Tax=Saccharomyces paradoxus TaxID=27291 RepID=A0A8B8UNB9_SACPA|nr:Yfh1 [Saccharomyces paradoxus]QHS72119.1 Yfh1 [Saccharomyces paradoxus]